ncbi:MAG: desulfoferrodoxin [Bacteroidales bacterium]|nr:desulfoferrodoxin [Bacteroidales bacterium]
MKQNDVLKCAHCGAMVEVLHEGKGEIICCGEPMQILEANTVDAAVEKHVPVIEKTEKGYTVKVGSMPHPMIDTHYIEWIELISDNKVQRKYLKPGEEPEASFCCCCTSGEVFAREYCNLHGLWRSK